MPPWTEQERLTREKAVLGFFISGHPLAKYRAEVELFGNRTTATLGTWSDQKVAVAAVVTVVKRQISKKSGAEYARLVARGFPRHRRGAGVPGGLGTAQLRDPHRRRAAAHGQLQRPRSRRGAAPFIVEAARPLEELKASGQVGLALCWSAARPPDPEATRAAAALCAAHPGPAPVLVEWEGGNGGSDGRGAPLAARLVSRSLRVEPDEELLGALRGIFGADGVHLVKAS